MPSCRIIDPIRWIGFNPANRRARHGEQKLQIPLSIYAIRSFFPPLRNNYTAVKRDRRATSSLLVLDRRYRSHSSQARYLVLPPSTVFFNPLSPSPGNYPLRPRRFSLFFFLFSSLFVGISRTNRIPGFTVRYAAVGNVRHVRLHACMALSYTAWRKDDTVLVLPPLIGQDAKPTWKARSNNVPVVIAE